MTYVRVVDPPMTFLTTGYVALLDEKRPALATGSWADVWNRVETVIPAEEKRDET